jgi:hypothetical protein
MKKNQTDPNCIPPSSFNIEEEKKEKFIFDITEIYNKFFKGGEVPKLIKKGDFDITEKSNTILRSFNILEELIKKIMSSKLIKKDGIMLTERNIRFFDILIVL